jgi:hypothetical protein
MSFNCKSGFAPHGGTCNRAACTAKKDEALGYAMEPKNISDGVSYALLG